jgi:hypothetical protein
VPRFSSYDDQATYSTSIWSGAAERSVYHWKQPGVADAYGANVPLVYRREAQRKLHTLAAKYQRLVARQLLQDDRTFTPKVALQLAPFYTSCPRQLSAWACLGLTVYLEYEARQADNLVHTFAKPFLAAPAQADPRYKDVVQRVDAACLKAALEEIAAIIQRRVILDVLRRVAVLGMSVEYFRVYAASILDRSYPTLTELIAAPILAGDLIADWRALKPHPSTLRIMEGVQRSSMPYLSALSAARSEDLAKLGVDWLKDVGLVIAPYLPAPSAGQISVPAEANESANPGGCPGSPTAPTRENELLPPLGAPARPTFIKRQDGRLGMVERLRLAAPSGRTQAAATSGAPKPTDAAAAALERLGAALQAISQPCSKWEDAAFDDIERRMASAPFTRSPIEGAPQEGHEVHMTLDGKTYSGSVYEQVVAPSAGDAEVERLEQEAAPLTRALSSLLYPSVEERTVSETGLHAGRLDARRLYRARYSERLFRRNRFVTALNKTGGPVLLLLLDASGSIGREEMRLTKLTAAAFHGATRGTRMKLMCAAYNEGPVSSQAAQGAIIRWLYHPTLSMAADKREALRCLGSVADSGAGGQQDALSLAFCLSAARRLAGRDNIYLVLISDMGWCKSFSGQHTALNEVKEFFVNARATLGNQFHSTLVALSCTTAATSLDDVVDSVIPVPATGLASYGLVADRLSRYVAKCMRDRRRLSGGA